jgi:hypothetical protein
MQMGMSHQVLSPGVKDSQEADLGSEVFGIRRDRPQRLRCSPEENAVNDTLVLKRNRGKSVRHSKDDVEMLDRKEFCLPSLKPLRFGQGLALWAVSITARAIRKSFMPTAVTLIPMTAKGGRPAKLNGSHDTSLARRQAHAMNFAVLRPVAAENIRYLKRRSRHDRRATSSSNPEAGPTGCE